ncbi:polar amino acid transport system permease protein [Aquamicrobium terrae]|uniref:amino acid ABC transporter permease n=1 Tax=Mesorhizobium sp. PUT5 TaxID=3454629 RepID=UPI003FA46C4B
MSFNLDVFWAALTSWVFFEAALISVALAVLSHASAIAISMPLALGLDSRSKVVRIAIRLYVGVFRAIPTLLWLLFFWNALPQFSPVFREAWYTPFIAAWVALTVNEAAYQVEINRAALSSVDKGQTSAATAFGFTPWQVFRLVTLPQAARVALPPSVNEFITLLKATSLASVISLQELMTVTNQAVATSFQFQEYYAVAALYYLLIVGLLTLLQSRVERRFDWTVERRARRGWLGRFTEQRQ